MRAGARAGGRNDGPSGGSSRRQPLTGNALPHCQARVGLVIAGVGSRVVTVRVSLIGFTAGFLNGLIGIGGGVVMVPGLIEYRRASPQVAVGSSLAAMVVFSAIALLVHASASGLVVDPVWLAVVIVCGVMGSQIGTGILARLATRWLLLLFAGLVLLVSTRLLVQGLGIVVDATHWAGSAPWWSYPAVGFASGLLSGVFGIGGGGLVLLGFAVMFGLPVAEGLPLALAVNVTNALAGCVRHARAGRVLWPDVGRMIPAAVVGIALGAVLALWIPPDGLRIVFAAFFMFMAIRVARQGMRQ